MNRYIKKGRIPGMVLMVCLIMGGGDMTVSAGPEKSDKKMSLDPEFHPKSGTYHYRVNWNNVNIGNAQIGISQDQEVYVIALHAETNSKIDKIYKVRYKGESRMSSEPLAPIEAKIHEKVKSTNKETTILFQEDGSIKSTEVKTKKGDPPKTTERHIQTENFALDPFSAAFLVQRLDWEEGVAEVFDVVTGSKQYILSLKCIKKTPIDIEGEKRVAWEILPELVDQNKKNGKKDKNKINDMMIYVSADAPREVLKIKVALKIGYFRVILEKFEPESV